MTFKTIKEQVLYDMKYRHPEYANTNHETAIDLTIERVLELIDKLKKKWLDILCNQTQEELINLANEFVKELEELKKRITG